MGYGGTMPGVRWVRWRGTVGTVEGYGGHGGHSGYSGSVGAVEGGYTRMVEKYKDEGRKMQIAALTGGRYLGTFRNRIGELC